MRRALAAAAATAGAALAAAAPAGAQSVALGAYIPGAPQSAKRIDDYARKTGRSPAILLYYRSWQEGDTFDETTLERLRRRRALPMITWEPWDHRLADIAAGEYDDYLWDSAADARRWGRTILVRFAHEANGDWYPWSVDENSPSDYVRAWRHVVRVFRRAGAGNVRWVWTPNTDYGGARMYRALYPGDRYVDWVGLSGFSWGGPWEWQSVSELFADSYRAIVSMTAKPFVIAETAAGEIGGDKRAWIDSAFRRELPELDRVRAVVWFNGKDKWAEWDVDSTPGSLSAFRDAVAAPRYSAGARFVAGLSRSGWAVAGVLGRMR